MQQTINKKFNILQELEQAIKRKAVEKQRSREHTNKQLLMSIDKRRAESKSVIPPREKNSDKRESHSRKTPSKDEQIMRPFVLNNENAGMDQIEKKQVGKRLDKLFSLVNYTISSAEKAIKFVNTANFEAEFAVKLFKSDRDSLLLEIQSFVRTEEEQARSPTSDGRKQPQATLTNLQNHSLKNENSTLRKQNLIAEAEISKLKEEKTLLAEELRSLKSLLSSEDKRERTRIKDKEKEIDNLLREIHEIDEVKRVDKSREAMLKHNLFLKEKEMEKVKSKMREAYPLEALQRFYEAIEKETKFNMMLFANFENPRKKGELETILKSLEADRVVLEKKLTAVENKTSSRYAQLRNYIAARVLPLIDGYANGSTSGLTDTEVLEMFLRDVCSKQRARTTGNAGTSAYEKQIAQLKNEKASLTNQVEILKIQISKDRSEQLKKTSKQTELLQANIEEIYDDLLNICESAELLKDFEGHQPDFQHLIEMLREFVRSTKHSHNLEDSKLSSHDPDKKIMAVELATEKKLNRQRLKQIEDLERLNESRAERISQLEGDLDKVSRRIEKLQGQREQDRELSYKFKDLEAEVRRANERVTSLQDDLELSEKTKQELLEALRDTKKQMQASEAKADRISKKEKGLEDTIQEMRKSQDFLKLQMEKLKQQKTTAEETLNAEIDKLTKALEESREGAATSALAKNDTESQQIREQVVSLQKTVDQLRQRITETESKLQKANKEISQAENTLKKQTLSAQQLLVRASQQKEELQESYERQLARLKDSLQKASQLLKHLEQDKRNIEQEQVTLLNNISKLQRSNSQLEEQKRKLEDKASRLEDKLAEAEEARQEYTQKLQKELKFVQKQLAEEKSGTSQLKNECVAQKVINVGLSAEKQLLSKKAAQLQATVQELETIIEQLHDRIAVVKNTLQPPILQDNSELEARQATIEQLTKIVSRLAGELETIKLTRPQDNPAEGMGNELRQRIAGLEQEVEKHKKHLAEVLTVQFTRDIEQINRLQKQQKLQAAKYNQRCSQLEVSLSELRSKLTEKNAVAESASVEFSLLKCSYEELSRQLEHKDQDHQALARAQTLVKELRLQLSQTETKVSELEAGRVEMEGELRKTQEQLNRSVTARSSTDQSSLLLKKYIQEAEKQKAITAMKLTNYTNLVKSILKKIVDIEDIEQEDLDTLLEKGAQKVFEWKKNRNWESSYKAVDTAKPDINVEPFGMESMNKKPIEQPSDNALADMGDFEEMSNQSMENSIVHDQGNTQVEHPTLQHQQEDLQKLIAQQQQHTESHQVPDSRLEEVVEQRWAGAEVTSSSPAVKQQPVSQTAEAGRLKTESSGGLRDFAEFKESSMSQSMLSDQPAAKPKVEIQNLEEFIDYQNDPMSNSMMSDHPAESESKDEPAINIAEAAPENTQEIKAPIVPSVIADMDEFADYQQRSMSGSMISEKNAPKTHQAVQKTGLEIEISKPSQETQKPKAEPESEKLADVDEFADFKDNSLHASMISNHGQQLPEAQSNRVSHPQKQPLLNEFSDFHEGDMEHSRSIHPQDAVPTIKIKQKPEQAQEQKKQPEQQEGADFNEFGSFHNESLSNSQISAKLRQFEDFPDDFERALDSSMLSENQFKQVNEANLHNILEGENMDIFEQGDKDNQLDFQDFLQTSTIKKKEQS